MRTRVGFLSLSPQITTMVRNAISEFPEVEVLIEEVDPIDDQAPIEMAKQHIRKKSELPKCKLCSTLPTRASSF